MITVESKIEKGWIRIPKKSAPTEWYKDYREDRADAKDQR